MKTVLEIVEALRHKLRLFRIGMDGSARIFYDNEAAHRKTSIPDSAISKKHFSIAHHMFKEAVEALTVRIVKEGTMANIADFLTKLITEVNRNSLLDYFMH